MDQLARQHSRPTTQGSALTITLRYERENKIFNIEIEQSTLVSELIEEMRGQLNIPQSKAVILQQGQTKLEANKPFSVYGFPNQIMIDIITENAPQNNVIQREAEQSVRRNQPQPPPYDNANRNDREIMLVIKAPQQNKVLNVQMPEGTKICDLIEQLKQQLQIGRQDQIQLIYQGISLDRNQTLLQQKIPKGAELIVSIVTQGG